MKKRDAAIKLVTVLALLPAMFLGSCCTTHEGYGRYTLSPCDAVEVEGESYELTKSGSALVIDGHTVGRGIYRKTRPWLYVHAVGSDTVDVTFDSGSKSIYPLYTGSSASIFDVYAHPWEIARSTCAAFGGEHWLVAHRWSDTGVYFDLQRKVGNDTQWQLLQADIFVPASGAQVDVTQIQTGVKVVSFDGTAKTATVQFVALAP